MNNVEEYGVTLMSKSEQENTNGGFWGLIGFVVGAIIGWAIVDGRKKVKDQR